MISPVRDGRSHWDPAEILDVLHDTDDEPIVDADGADIEAFPGGFPHIDEKGMVRSPASA